MPHALIQSAYPQALSLLINICNDVALAEDCIQDAVEQALKHWPGDRPDNPVAWLVRVGRNKFIDIVRRHKKQTDLSQLEENLDEPDLSEQALLQSYNDDLLRLIFTCSHPALNLQTQVALTLKHVLGLSVEQIANALLVSNKSMEQRLTRAKAKIEACKIEYQIPPQDQWAQRLNAVLKTIYLLFNEGYLTTSGKHSQALDLCQEAIRLCRLLHSCIKDDPEIIGLLALLLQQKARSKARFSPKGEVILLKDQDRSLYNQAEIAEANVLVEKALRIGRGSPYAIQAAIASLYNQAKNEASTDWLQIDGLYRVLIKLDDNPVIKLNAAVVTAKTEGIDVAIQQVLSLSHQLKSYRHFYSCLAGLYFEQKSYRSALDYYRKTLEITHSEAEKRFILTRIDKCTTFIQM